MSDHTRWQRLEGLEPDNLLAFIALLGLLRSLDTARPSWHARAAWDLDQPPLRPVLHLAEPQTRDMIGRAAAEGISRLAEYYVFPAAPGGSERQRDLNYSTVGARELLTEASSNQDRERVDVLAALMCDAAGRDGRIEATPFCLLFGQGHQHFLERLSQIPRLAAPPRRGRGKAAIELTPTGTIAEALFQPWERRDPTPAFRWDPAEDVRYALRADDPSGDKATTQHGANRLAAIGLSALTVAPAQRADRVRLQVIGGSTGRDFAFCWPIWREPASLATIRALLSHPDLDKGQEALAYFGVVQVRRARRISVGKFMNFTRADIL